MSDKEHCRCCGAELVMCDECHGAGQVQVDGPMDPETGEIGYSESCGECGGRGGYAAPAITVVELEKLAKDWDNWADTHLDGVELEIAIKCHRDLRTLIDGRKG